MTTQAVILAAVTLASSVTLTLLDSSPLPTQEKKQGRPRKNGRVSVERGNLTPEQFSVHMVRARLSTDLGVSDPKSLTHYLRECSADRITFVVPGLDSNTRVRFSASVEAVTVAEMPIEATVTVAEE